MCCVSDWGLDEGKRTCIDWELNVCMSGEIKINRFFFRLSGLSSIQCMDQNKPFAIKVVFRKKNVFGGDFYWRKPVITEKHEFDFQDKLL